jgi:uncharacterized membrane protein YeaQ/YmgE (transglycosylase-associated protein family)
MSMASPDDPTTPIPPATGTAGGGGGGSGTRNAGGSTDDDASSAGKPAGKIEQLRIIGGLIALSAGLASLLVVVIVALIVKPDTTGGSIATAAIGVIGSIVGAYFGVKIGTDGTKAAVSAQQDEATKAQVYALHTPSEKAGQVTADIERLLKAQNPPGTGR